MLAFGRVTLCHFAGGAAAENRGVAAGIVLAQPAAMTSSLAPYRLAPLCPAHAAAVETPACPRCAREWVHAGSSEGRTLFRDRSLRRTFLSGLFAATAFGAVIGTAIGFVAGASPLWASPARTRRVASSAPPPPAVRGQPSDAVAPPPVGRPDPEPVAAEPIAPPIAALTPLLAEVGGRTRDGEVLLERIQGLVRAGLPMVVESRRLPRSISELVDSRVLSSVRIIPLASNGRIVGVKLYGVRPRSLLDEVGLENGDVLLAVDGVEMIDDPTSELFPFPGARRMVVLEIARGGEPRILVVRW